MDARGRRARQADRGGIGRAARTAGGRRVRRRTPPRSAMRVATAPLFGGGTVAVVVDPAPLLRSKADREALEAAIRDGRPGQRARVHRAGRRRARSGRRRCRASRRRCSRPAATAKAYKAPTRGPARRPGSRPAPPSARCTLEPGAAKELARRVGGFVREGDVDRQRQGALAVGELEKLALYRPFDPVSEDDVRALVAEVVPDSTWAFLDAVAERKVAVAGPAARPPARDDARAGRHSSSSIAGSASCSSRRPPRGAARPPGSLVADARHEAVPGGEAGRARRARGGRRARGRARGRCWTSTRWSRARPTRGSTDAQRRLAFSLWIGSAWRPPPLTRAGPGNRNGAARATPSRDG